MNQVKKNFIYNVFYQILAIIVPLITTPYASRVLGADGVGTYSYTYSIVYYFMLAAMLGINNYGSREIAKNRKNKEETSTAFWSIYAVQFIMSILVIAVYMIYVLNFAQEYKNIFIIQSLYVLSAMLDINWFYYGIENFRLTVTRNSLIKILSVILIFVFVKTRQDVWIYTLILAGSTLFSNCILLAFLKKYVDFKKIKKQDIIKHLKPCLILFIPVIAMKIYKVMDKTMIGVLSNVTEVGYYANADGIINIPMGIIIALGTVMLPRLSNMISNGDKENANKLLLKTVKFAIFMAVPIMFGILGIGKDFSIVFLGKEFAKTGTILQLLSVTILFMTIANVLRTQYLIPNNQDKQYIIAIVAGAVVNLILNSILIKPYGSIGACAGTILAEFTVMVLHVWFTNKQIPIVKKIFEEKWIFFKGIIMFIVVYLIGRINFNVSIGTTDIGIYIKLCTQVIAGVIVYAGLNYRYIIENIDFKKILKRGKV